MTLLGGERGLVHFDRCAVRASGTAHVSFPLGHVRGGDAWATASDGAVTVNGGGRLRHGWGTKTDRESDQKMRHDGAAAENTLGAASTQRREVRRDEVAAYDGSDVRHGPVCRRQSKSAGCQVFAKVWRLAVPS